MDIALQQEVDAVDALFALNSAIPWKRNGNISTAILENGTTYTVSLNDELAWAASYVKPSKIRFFNEHGWGLTFKSEIDAKAACEHHLNNGEWPNYHLSAQVPFFPPDDLEVQYHPNIKRF